MVEEDEPQDQPPDTRPAAAVTIRPTRVNDAEALCAMANLPGFRWGTLRPPFGRVEETRKWLERLGDADLSVMAEVGGKPVGNAGLRRLAGRRVHVGTVGMGVHDDFRGRGVGTALMAALVDAADNWLGLRRVELTVYADNAPALALYRRFGFVEEGRHTDFAFRAGRYVDALAMARLIRR